jgi:hypothetical protein
MTLRTYLNQSRVNFNINKLGTTSDIKFSDIKLPFHIQLYDDGLSDDLNEFYQFIKDDKLNLMFKLFRFRSYIDIISDYKELINENKTKLLIGYIYQGMGYYVSLYYDIEREYYFFIEQGGNNYLTCDYNDNILYNLGPITKEKQFATIKECLDLINDINCQYFDDMKFLQCPYLVN